MTTDPRSLAEEYADKFFGVTFEGLNTLGGDSYSAKTVRALERNSQERPSFLAGFKAALSCLEDKP